VSSNKRFDLVFIINCSDPDAEVIALSLKTLMATNRFVCEICNKGFQRDQNLQDHRRGHNLPWKLKQRNNKEVRKRAYVCPEPSCVHHHPSRALSDLTGIKKHYCRKHREKKWKFDKCSKIYAVQSDIYAVFFFSVGFVLWYVVLRPEWHALHGIYISCA
jgi:hypothetical protein